MNNLTKKKSQKIIDDLLKQLGMEEQNRTVFHLKNINEKEKQIILDAKCKEVLEPWFIIDENDEVKTMFSIKTLIDFFQKAKEIQRHNFELRLEKAIYQQIPIDFRDVWIVAMDEIQKQINNGTKEANIDLEQLITNIHIKHPNLFFNMKEMAQKVQNNERL
ncbi:DUF2603 domain-containing protein [Campylobacter insulaenigrae]|uniref:DUF2603 domain-containing protein n=1 Tax=Campylobacter insulaenigrae TaxID=260714 RepID=UPI00242AC67E|nr:DUF2603 domain-containing protein [Campylobacter insulaenigrae]